MKKSRSWFVKKLAEMNACSSALRYAQKHRTFASAWNTCSELFWFEWLLEMLELLPKHDNSADGKRCRGCAWAKQKHTVISIRKRFSAERVAKALRAAKD